MDRLSIMWVVNSCILALDGVSKEQMIKWDTPKELAEMGLKLCEFLKLKEIDTPSTQ